MEQIFHFVLSTVLAKLVNMSKTPDLRRKIGAHVLAKASVVTSNSECKRLYGVLWKTMTVAGIVKEVLTPPKGSGK